MAEIVFRIVCTLGVCGLVAAALDGFRLDNYAHRLELHKAVTTLVVGTAIAIAIWT